MFLCVVCYRLTGFLEVGVASIFRVEKYSSKATNKKQAELEYLAACLAYSSTLKMEAVHFSEMSLIFFWAT
jgi:hypothetical protein